MRLVKATDQDNRKLIQFFAQTTVPGPLDLQFHRHQDFFLPYKILTDDFVTYMLLDEDENIAAVATLSFRPGYINGRFELIGYATDLRVANNRRAILSWAQFFLPVIEQERAHRGCKYIFTVVPQSQRQAYNAFVRPKNIRRHLPRYYLVRNFSVMSIHGAFPLAQSTLPSVLFRKATDNDGPVLFEYIARHNRQSSLCFNITSDDVKHSLARWPNFSVKDFWLALNYEQKIIGCVAPWRVSQLHDIHVAHLEPGVKSLHETLSFLKWLRLTRPLMTADNKLLFYYLTHFYADNPDVFVCLLQTAWQNTPRDHFLTYTQFESDYFRLPAKHQISSRMKCGLYCILAPYDPLPDFVHKGISVRPPELELPLL